MNVEVRFNVDPLILELEDTRRRQLPFARALAINRTIEEAQVAIRQRMFQRGFTVRSAASARWLANSIKIRRDDRATKDNPVGRVRIESPGKGGGRAGLLGFLEEGGTRFSQAAIGAGFVFGASSVAIPQRRSPSEQMPRSLYPTMVGLQERRRIEGGLSKVQLKGKRRVFAIRTGFREGLILQRTGSGPRDTRVLFLIRPQIRVTGRQFFFPTAERVFRERFDVNLAGFMVHAMRTAR